MERVTRSAATVVWRPHPDARPGTCCCRWDEAGSVRHGSKGRAGRHGGWSGWIRASGTPTWIAPPCPGRQGTGRSHDFRPCPRASDGTIAPAYASSAGHRTSPPGWREHRAHRPPDRPRRPCGHRRPSG
ncbi:hypothetical protein EGY25_03840 [Brevundimonas intermedia]|uniref:Uncharacterized protein n=1 Tax=Brevundimonas intermedia TaxID=74315 RepID=A0A4Y9S488_9CAUL|nr:hypothetical protein EGY25_03840 [Brevundimonas intermedia]